jgi:SAM-dependent methyltransferase
MTELEDFYSEQAEFNQFDNLKVDVGQTYYRFALEAMASFPGISPRGLEKTFQRFYKSPLFLLKFRLRVWQALFHSNLDQYWYREFSEYWTTVLGGRPLWSVYDFFFLKNLYRIKFQRSRIPNTTKSQVHLNAWQRPELLYQLLHLVSKESSYSDALIVQKVLRLVPRRKDEAWLEFGSGTAPLTSAAVRFFYLPRNLQIHISDIQTLAFHYASFFFRKSNLVRPMLLREENRFALELDKNLDVIFCIQVLEHLNNPLEIVEHFSTLLRSGGVLVFDFMRTSGQGMDTLAAQKERPEVLAFISDHFMIEKNARLDPDTDTQLTFAVKK